MTNLRSPRRWRRSLPLAWLTLSLIVAACNGEPAGAELAAPTLSAPPAATAAEASPAATAAGVEAGGETAPAVATAAPGSLVTPAGAAPAESAADGTVVERTPAILADLVGLPLDAFFEESFNQLLRRDPEFLTEIGASSALGLRNDRLNDLSPAYVAETQALQSGILTLLESYDRQALAPDDQLSWDIYHWYLDDLVRGQPFAGYDYPIHHMIESYHDALHRLFVEYHPWRDRQDAEDYVTRLSLVGAQVEQLVANLERSRAAGVVAPRHILEMARSQIRQQLQLRSPDGARIDPEQLAVYVNFRDRIGELSDLSAADQQQFLGEAVTALETSYIPGHLALLDEIDRMLASAGDAPGVWQFPDGDAYYSYRLRSQTSTDLTAAEVHALGLAEVARIQAEIEAVFAELGYPAEASFEENMARAINEAGFYDTATAAGQAEYVADTEALIAEAVAVTAPAFASQPATDVAVVAGPFGGFYVPAPVDGSRPGQFYVGVGDNRAPRFGMATVAYHEAVPGHHTQIATAQELDLPTFRRTIIFNGYAEGWALYAERLAWEMGLYEDDPHGNLGRLRLELLRAVRLVVDTGIHDLGWSRQEARNTINEIMGERPVSWAHEADRYTVWPAQATGYKIGMLKILELRQRAQEALGERFDLQTFHQAIIGRGSMPLAVLEQVVDDYIAAELAS